MVGVIFQKGNENFYDNQYIETTNTQLTQECLEWHNYFRQLHGAQPLTYSHEVRLFFFFAISVFLSRSAGEEIMMMMRTWC